jgi:hypothetical protein
MIKRQFFILVINFVINLVKKKAYHFIHSGLIKYAFKVYILKFNIARYNN